ncbi:MAG: hypothetical protein JWP70_669 [Leifsonia sp.]|nr:hypothetical protein [Leifsonia sp.]MDQ1589070.1 hypothetical protein [Microbacteriaceae bacterium]
MHARERIVTSAIVDLSQATHPVVVTQKQRTQRRALALARRAERPNPTQISAEERGPTRAFPHKNERAGALHPQNLRQCPDQLVRTLFVWEIRQPVDGNEELLLQLIVIEK